VPYNSQPRVGVAPLPGARISPSSNVEAFGGGIASERGTLGDLSGATRAAQGIAAETQRIRAEAQAEADQVATTHAHTALVTGVNDILHGQDGLLNRRGQDAFTIDQDAYDRYGKMVADIRQNLGTERQRAIYDKMVLNEWNQVVSQVQPHIAAQRKAYDKEGTDAGIEANHTRAITSYDNPIVVEDAIANQVALVGGFLKRQGFPDEAIANRKAAVESDTRLDVLKQYVDSRQDQTATEYFNAHKDKFVGDTLPKAEALIRRGTVEGEGIRQADTITATAKDEADALAQTASIAEPQVREKAEQRISLYYNRKAAATRQVQDDAFQQGYQTLRAHGWDLSSVPLSVRNRMGAMHEENLVRASEHEQKVAVAGPPGDPEQYQILLNEAYFQPEQFASRNILDEKGLSTRQINQLQTLQRTVGNRVQRTDEASIVKGMKATETAGVPPTDPNAAALSKDPALDAALGGGRPLATAGLKEPTPSMLLDVARSGGGGSAYSQLLRDSGFAIPRTLPAMAPAPPAPKPKPATHKTVVNRDAAGRITDTTTTVTKPE
jgi:hypothetical protein